jgi:hypothetical protein
LPYRLRAPVNADAASVDAISHSICPDRKEPNEAWQWAADSPAEAQGLYLVVVQRSTGDVVGYGCLFTGNEGMQAVNRPLGLRPAKVEVRRTKTLQT